MYKLLHIHTDSKFIHDSLKYVDERIYNEIIFVGKENETTRLKLENYKIPFEVYDYSETLVEVIFQKLEQFDGIVLNELCFFKAKLIDHIPKNKFIYLRLFGYELYKNKLKGFVSDLTWEELKKDKHSKSSKKGLKRKVKDVFRLNDFLENRATKRRLKRINAILLVNEFEYKQLSEYYKLPKFIQIPLHEKVVSKLSLKKNDIIVGNSKAYWNNHLDVLELIKKNSHSIKYNFQLFFSYGPENSYTTKVRETAKNTSNIHLIDGFLPIEEFKDKYSNASALIINSYRQHALANIIFAVLYGLKIYLNTKSSTYHWLVNNGFVIGEIKDLEKDLEKDNLKLSKEEQQNNINSYLKLQNIYKMEDFVNNILSLKNE